MATKKVQEELRVTPITQWPEKKGPEMVQLPSGAVAMLIEPNIYLMTRTGKMPARLRAMLASVDQTKYKQDPIAALGDDTEPLFDWMVAAAFVEPVVLLQEDEVGRLNASLLEKGESPKYLYIGMVDETDKQFIIQRYGLKL